VREQRASGNQNSTVRRKCSLILSVLTAAQDWDWLNTVPTVAVLAKTVPLFQINDLNQWLTP
jgi:hypothetical protein